MRVASFIVMAEIESTLDGSDGDFRERKVKVGQALGNEQVGSVAPRFQLQVKGIR